MVIDQGYAHPELLMSAEDLKSRQGDENLVLIDTRPAHEFAAGHIPGAVHWDLYSIGLIDTSPAPFAAFMHMIGILLSQRGVASDQTVVFYETASDMRAARGFWFCEYFGHEDVHVLDGGLNAWMAAGYGVTTHCVEPKRGMIGLSSIPSRHINVDEMNRRLGKDGLFLLDTRSADEYYGRRVRAKRGGVIPGAVHLEYVNNVDANGIF